MSSELMKVTKEVKEWIHSSKYPRSYNARFSHGASHGHNRDRVRFAEENKYDDDDEGRQQIKRLHQIELQQAQIKRDEELALCLQRQEAVAVVSAQQDEAAKAARIIQEDDEEEIVIKKYPKFDIKLGEVILGTSFKVRDGSNTRLLRMKSKQQLYPIIFDRSVYEKEDGVLEIVGYTCDLVNKEVDASEFKKKWHPFMEEVVKFYNSRDYKVRISPTINQYTSSKEAERIKQDMELALRLEEADREAVRRQETDRIKRDMELAVELVKQDMELAARQEAARQEAARQEAARQEAARQEAARQEAARQEEWLRNAYPRDGWSSHCYPVYY